MDFQRLCLPAPWAAGPPPPPMPALWRRPAAPGLAGLAARSSPSMASSFAWGLDGDGLLAPLGEAPGLGDLTATARCSREAAMAALSAATDDRRLRGDATERGRGRGEGEGASAASALGKNFRGRRRTRARAQGTRARVEPQAGPGRGHLPRREWLPPLGGQAGRGGGRPCSWGAAKGSRLRPTPPALPVLQCCASPRLEDPKQDVFLRKRSTRSCKPEPEGAGGAAGARGEAAAGWVPTHRCLSAPAGRSFLSAIEPCCPARGRKGFCKEILPPLDYDPLRVLVSTKGKVRSLLLLHRRLRRGSNARPPPSTPPPPLHPTAALPPVVRVSGSGPALLQDEQWV